MIFTMPPRSPFCLRGLGLLLGSVLCVAAQDTAKKPISSDTDLRIQGIFNTGLPRTEPKNSLKLIVHPHMGDILKKDHIRTAMGVRYGLTNAWEATAEVDTFFTHGLKEGKFFDDAGLSSLHVGSKYRVGDPLHLGWESVVGLDWIQPIMDPPSDVTDGLRHAISYVTLSRELKSRPGWRVFFGANYDDVAPTNIVGEPDDNQLTGDNVGVTAGFVVARGRLNYTLEAAYNTQRPTENINNDLIALRPGIVWAIPPRYTFGGRGQWLLGVSLRLAHGPDGGTLGAQAKLRFNFDFKKMLGHKPAPAAH
jgi:hypothetical protein